jgi:hypothetical protein
LIIPLLVGIGVSVIIWIMKLFIDQSGKVEDTSKNTVLAFSNKINGSILIKAVEKRKLLRMFREQNRPKIFTFQLFSILIYELLVKYKIKNHIVCIDIEYPGQNDLIKSYLIQLVNKFKGIDVTSHDIYFALVGKQSNVHKVAITGLRKNKAEFCIQSKDIVKKIVFLSKFMGKKRTGY